MPVHSLPNAPTCGSQCFRCHQSPLVSPLWCWKSGKAHPYGISLIGDAGASYTIVHSKLGQIRATYSAHSPDTHSEVAVFQLQTTSIVPWFVNSNHGWTTLLWTHPLRFVLVPYASLMAMLMAHFCKVPSAVLCIGSTHGA